MKWFRTKKSHKNMKEQENINNEEKLQSENAANEQNENTVNEQNADNAANQNADASEKQEADSKAEEAEERDPLNVALEEIESLKKQLLYKQAEFENYRKRTMKEKAELILGGGEKTITAILPVLDDFERAMADKSEDPTAIREGMTLIFNKFKKILEQQGVSKIETDGAKFDVDYHEAIAMVPGLGDDKKDMVIDCVQTGYMLNDKVIRHAKVAVGA